MKCFYTLALREKKLYFYFLIRLGKVDKSQKLGNWPPSRPSLKMEREQTSPKVTDQYH